MPCYDFAPLTEPSLGRALSIRIEFRISDSYTKCADFGYSQLVWRDGRWVQDSGTYSSPHSWSAITSDSSFMRASCSPQSELRPVLMGFAPPCDLATHCTGHCITCAAQGIRGPCWFGVILTFLPIVSGSPLWHIKHRARVTLVIRINGTSHDTSWRQPCSTWTSALWESNFHRMFTSLSSPGKVLRLLSN